MKGKKLFKYVVCFAIVFALVGMFFVSMLNIPKASAESGASLSNKNDTFTPIVRKPEWVDQDNNEITDTLDQEIADRLANGTAQGHVNVTVMLNSEPTAYDANAFASSGGYVTTPPWTYAIYGFGGQIPYKQIVNFTKQNPNVLLVEKEAVCSAKLAYAAQQVGARTYVWNTLGLQGDPLSSIAIIDTGIDDSHPDFSPGFGTGDFSKKIVAWNDQITPGTTSPYDDNGHGSHVSGLAAGNGFFSVDDSGYATATWGANLGRIGTSGTYLITGMMVNRTGPITVEVKWTSTRKGPSAGSLSALLLYDGNKTLSTTAWTKVAEVSTPTRDTWYTLTYDVPFPSGGYDMYHPLLTLTAGSGDLYVVFTMSWPYTPPVDGFSAWTGIAPQAKLVGVKALNYAGSGTSTGLINGIDWIIDNRMAYNITVASMSLGFTSEVTTVNTAVANLVNSGVTTIATAGNDGSGANYIYTPGSVDEVITVAAMNQFDNIASYSSQGGTRAGKQTMKPDITAPGGSFFAVPLFSADSNDQDADNRWLDTLLDDAAPMQGTSMSAPVVAGAANIIIQAMGSYSNWEWTRAQALLPKMILLMTATETYPNLREPSSTAAPTLERGGKDVHEGYGRTNLDAAVDAILNTYEIGTTVTDALGKPPTLSDISVLGQKLAWARNVQLVSGFSYTFTLNVPEGADYDLYLYNNTGTTYGEPAIVVNSTTAADGGTEEFTVTAPYSGTYYIVVKRATETTGSVVFTLESTAVGFDLNLRVMDWDLTDSIEGAYVYVNSDVKTSDVDGWANWTGVSGTVEIEVEYFGFTVYGTIVEVDSDTTMDLQCHIFSIIVTCVEEVQGAVLQYVNVTVYNATSTASNMIRTGITGSDGKVSLANVPNSTLTFTCYDGASPQHVIATVTRTITTENQAESITCDQNFVSTSQAWGIIAKYNTAPLTLGLLSVFNPKIVRYIKCLKERTETIRSKQSRERGGESKK